jgi:hypothetical protein
MIYDESSSRTDIITRAVYELPHQRDGICIYCT